MADAAPRRIVIIGGGPTGRTAAALLPGAALVARPETTAWHVEPGTVWTWHGDTVTPIGFDTLVLAAPVPQLALALGCAMRDWQPMIDPAGRTSVAGVFAIGALIGAATVEEAQRQGRIVAQFLRDEEREGEITATDPPPAESGEVLCPCTGVTRSAITASGLTDPAAIADLFGLRAGACRMAHCGPLLGEAVTLFPAAPVPLTALASRAGAPPAARERQFDPRLSQDVP
jgi:NADPH-dependent 2,4-dienoyl-CoA reductase/sulfur reductase-like enzyme